MKTKLSFDAQEAYWDVDFIKDYQIDLTVLFRDVYEKYTTNCNAMGPGPYCSISMTSSVHNENDIIIRGTQLVLELNQGNIPVDSIASIVYSAGFSDFDGIQETAARYGSNTLFITDQGENKPSQVLGFIMSIFRKVKQYLF